MQHSTIQHENINKGHAATSIAKNAQNGVPFHEHKTRGVVSIHQPSHWQLSAVCQTRSHWHCCSLSFKSFKSHSRWSL